MHLQSHSHAFFLSVVDLLLPQAIHSLKNQSLEVLELQLSLKSPSAVELFKALPQSRLKEFEFTSFSSDGRVVRLCCSLMWLLLNSLLQVTWHATAAGGRVKWQPPNASWCDLLEGEMAVAAAVAQFSLGNMTLGVSRFDQLCWLPFAPILAFVMCGDQTVNSYDIIMARCINWSSKTQCIVPLSFHSLSSADLLHRRGLLSHVFCSSVCVVSSSCTDSSEVLTSLGVDTASIE